MWELRYSTGGSIPNILPQLSEQELNVTQSVGNTGNVSEWVLSLCPPQVMDIHPAIDVREVLDLRHRFCR